MKKNKLINGFLIVLIALVVTVSCSSDEEGEGKVSAGFASIASTFHEGNGDVTTTIPFVNGSVSASDIVFEGSATQGQDYQVLGVTSEGVQIKFIDDDDCEDIEVLRLRIKTSGVGNKVHTVTLFSNSNESFTAAQLAGTYVVVVDEWEDFVPGDELTVERIDDDHLRIVEYPPTGFDQEPLVITITDFETGEVAIESQVNGSYNASGTQTLTTAGAGVVSRCTGIELVLNFSLPCCGNFNGNALVLRKK
jgi:hypothetical protein